MQQLMKPVEDLLKTTTERLHATEQERDRAVDELQEMKKLAQDANTRLIETISTRKVADLSTQFNLTNDTLIQELKSKEKDIESLRIESVKAIKELEIKLVEKDASLDLLTGSLSNAKSSEAHATNLYSECNERLQELHLELENSKESEKKMLDSFVAQTKQLEQTMISFQESKLEIESLRAKVSNLEGSSGQNHEASSRENHKAVSCPVDTKERLESLKSELLLARANLARSQENEEGSSLKIKSLLDEVSMLKNELNLVSEAEENNKKALDDLALALKEVGLESSHVKEKLASTEAELDYTRSEAEKLRSTLKSIEDKYKAQLDELKKEADRHKNTAERLRIEAEESLLAWSEKETEFVKCIKRADEERDAAQEENNSLLESVRAAENMTKAAKEENLKLRDILKQAINEANVAKEASGIARQENSQLKDDLRAKEEDFNFIFQENENLKIHEAAALESIKELKNLLAESSAKESKIEDTEQGKKLKSENSIDKEHKEAKKLLDGFSINIKEVKIPKKHKDNADLNTHKNTDEDTKVPNKNNDEDSAGSQYFDALRGSIFDVNSPGSAAHHRRRSSITFSDDGKTIFTEDLEDGAHLDDSDSERSTRKKKALIRRFGDILMRRSTH